MGGVPETPKDPPRNHPAGATLINVAEVFVLFLSLFVSNISSLFRTKCITKTKARFLNARASGKHSGGGFTRRLFLQSSSKTQDL